MSDKEYLYEYDPLVDTWNFIPLIKKNNEEKK
jgi:hypothetical protein